MQNTLLQELVSKRYAGDTVGFEGTFSQPLPGNQEIHAVPNGDFSGDTSVWWTAQLPEQNTIVHNNWTIQNPSSDFSDVASMMHAPLSGESISQANTQHSSQQQTIPQVQQSFPSIPQPQSSFSHEIPAIDFSNTPHSSGQTLSSPSSWAVPENTYTPEQSLSQETFSVTQSQENSYPNQPVNNIQNTFPTNEHFSQPNTQTPSYVAPQEATPTYQAPSPWETQPTQETISSNEGNTTQASVVESISEIDLVNTNEKTKETKEEKAALLAAEKEYKANIATIKDAISPEYMKIFPDKIKINNVFAKTFFVYAYPNFLEWNWLSPIINWDTKFDMSLYVYPTDNAQIQKYLRKRLTQLRSENNINAQKWLVNDPAITAQIQDVEELRASLTRGSEKYFHFALYITVYAETEDKLNKIGKDVETILAGRNVLQKQSYLRSEQGFIATGPFAKDELSVYRNISTGWLSTTFPFSSSTLSHDDGILYGVNTHNNSLILFDRFRSENANMCVFAKSGWWKSFAVKLEILRSLMMGIDVVVIDPENEYRALVDVVGGSYLDVSLNSRERINPFDLPLSMKDKDTQPGDLLRDAIVNLLGLMNLMLGRLNGNESSIMEKAIIVTYNLKGITLEDDDITGKEVPTMRDLYSILETMDGAKDLCQRLEKYTTGIFSGVFSELTNISLSEGLQVFSVRDLDDILRPTAMYIILSYIWNRVRSSNKKRLLIIDEAWNIMQHEDSAKFLFGLVKRARKYNLWVTTITQDVEDFLASGYGKPIVTNSSIQLLLKQSPASIDALQHIFKITDQEKYILLNSNVWQWLFFAGSEHVGIQVIASFYEEQIVSTDPNRK